MFRRLFSRSVNYSSFPPGGLAGNGLIGVRREDKSRWERRAPLTPSHVESLVADGIGVLIQPSTTRIFTDEEYAGVGALVTEDISRASTIIGVKEVPVHKLMANRTMAFFSHTIKAQPRNMPILAECMANNIRLIDYERITSLDEETGVEQRLVRFGRFAGYAGVIDYLSNFGNRLLALGYSTPFLHIGAAHMYPDLATAKKSLEFLGQRLAKHGSPRHLGPLVFVLTGSGDVARGALEFLELLPHEKVSYKDLPHLVADASFDNSKVYIAIATSEVCMTRRNGEALLDKSHYYQHPEEYVCRFAERFAPYASSIIHCSYWDQRYPRLLEERAMVELLRTKRSRLIGVADLSADRGGAIEFVKQITTIDRPFYIADVEKGTTSNSMDSNERGVLVTSVDVLPSELPYEASQFFGDLLMPFVPQLVHSDASRPFAEQLEDLGGPLHRATIVANGKLTPNYEYIWDWKQRQEAELARSSYGSGSGSKVSGRGRRVLLLGAGSVADSAVRYLLKNANATLTIAADNLAAAEALAEDHLQVEPVEFKFDPDCPKSREDLQRLVSGHNVVLSLLPPPFHASVARACIDTRVPLVTSSYVSPELEAMSAEARQAGVTILAECGLDPGIDHMLAMKTIRDAYIRGGTLDSFVSHCGGLPSPEACNNPLGYKFSWSPRGVLTASSAPARFLLDGVECNLSPGEAVSKSMRLSGPFPALSLEHYPNRDSLPYIDIYKTHGAKTFVRGTLRYRGFGVILSALKDLGLLSTEPCPLLAPGSPTSVSWRAILQFVLEQKGVSAAGDLERATLQALNITNQRHAAMVCRSIEFLGLLDPLNEAPLVGNTFEAMCVLMQERLVYAENERDMILLRHAFKFVFPDGSEENKSVTLAAYGTNLATAMSTTVGTPAGIATRLILDDSIGRFGVVRPVTPDVYDPILTELHEAGIVWQDAPLPIGWIADYQFPQSGGAAAPRVVIEEDDE